MAKILETIFSIKNKSTELRKYKIITILGIKISLGSSKKEFREAESLFAKIHSGSYTMQDEEKLLKILFKLRTGKELNLDNPKTFREKIQWMKLYNRDPKLTLYSDKYRVREFIKEKIGEKYLTPLIGVYNNPDEIDFDKLPDKFVMKVNWGSGQNIIVKDKSALNIEEAKNKLNIWISKYANHYYGGLEWCYKNIKPKIIIEEYLDSLDNSALDYKFLCFNSKPYYCWVSNKNLDVQERSFYDMNWQMQDIELIEPHKVKAKTPCPKPENFDEMLEIVKTLCKGFCHVRVDLYKLNDGSIKFGELTFFTSSGYSAFSPEGTDEALGDLMDLSLIKKTQPVKKPKLQIGKIHKVFNLFGLRFKFLIGYTSSFYINKYLREIKPYRVSSHKIWDVLPQERDSVLKLDWNEASIPPSPLVNKEFEELLKNPNFLNLYPETQNKEIISLLSKYTKMPEENIQYFASSDSIHEYICKMYIRENDKVLISAPSYDNFRLTAQANGADIYYSEMNQNFEFDPEKFKKDIDKIKPSFVYITSPNNPTGYCHSIDFIENLLQTSGGGGIMFLVDEAYFEFSKSTMQELVLKYENILITRTLSKAFALANLRFGYLLGSANNIENISKIRNPKNINTFTQRAAIAVLSDIDYMENYVHCVNEAKSYFYEQMKEFKQITLYPSSANFILMKFDNFADKIGLKNYLEENNVFVRELTQSRILYKCLRITIGTKEQMELVVNLIKNYFESKKVKTVFDKEKIAFFDFCDTVVNFQTANAFLEYVVENIPKLKLKRYIRKKEDKFILKFNKRYNNKQNLLNLLKGLEYDEVDNLAFNFYIEKIRPNFYKKTIDELKKVKKEGYRVFVVSGGYDIYLKYFVREFELEGLFATKIGFKNNKCTGKFDGIDCMASNKVKLISDYFKDEPVQNYQTICYTDSLSDKPLMDFCKSTKIVIPTDKQEDWADKYEKIRV